MMPSKACFDDGLWDEEPYSGSEIRDAILQMHTLLIQKFPSRDLNCTSPVSLGRHLMAACWHRDNIKVPPAPSEIRDLLKSTSPQGRHEILTFSGIETIPALYEYDMRLAYLWCCKGLPYGKVEHSLEGSPAEVWHKAYCFVDAPLNWDHIGLLPHRNREWGYPLYDVEGWYDHREVMLADRSGWEVKRWETLTWEKEGALDHWSDGILWALRQVPEGGLVYRMLRRTALHTIGSLHQTTKRYERTGLEPPAGNPSTRLDQRTGIYSWVIEEPIKGRGQIYMHPEWSTTIWARCRARMAQLALRVPRRELIAIRQDALYTTTPQPQWEKPGPVPAGGVRLKWCIERSMPAPHSLDELDRLRRGEN